jgi:hypothetical protein
LNFGHVVIFLGIVVIPPVEIVTGTWGSTFSVIFQVVVVALIILIVLVVPFFRATPKRREAAKLRNQFPGALIFSAVARAANGTEPEPKVLIVDSGGIAEHVTGREYQQRPWTRVSAASVKRDYFGEIEATLLIRVNPEIEMAVVPRGQSGIAAASVRQIESIAARVNQYIAGGQAHESLRDAHGA